MRHHIKTLATVLIAGATLTGAASVAYAGFDEAGMNSFWSSAPKTSTAPVEPRRAQSSSRNTEYRATYSDPNVASRPATAVPSAQPEKDPQYFYHAMGTMSGQ